MEFCELIYAYILTYSKSKFIREKKNVYMLKDAEDTNALMCEKIIGQKTRNTESART